MKKRKKNSFPVKPALLLGAAGLLLLTSTVGSTRAALTLYSEDYAAQVNMSNIGVALLENDTTVSEQTYGKDEASAEGTLLENTFPKEEDAKFTPGMPYKEVLQVKNTGDIDIYVRVILTRSWQSDVDQDGEKEKDTMLSPSLIDLQLAEDSGWIVDESETYSDERIVLYYTHAVPPEGVTEALSDAIRIDPQIAQYVTVNEEGEYEYIYDGYSFCLEAEVNAVQTHNAADAIKSAWGVDVTVTDDDGGTITSVN